jgi:hypothetical protein
MKNQVADDRRQFAAVPALGGMLVGYASNRLGHSEDAACETFATENIGQSEIGSPNFPDTECQRGIAAP